MDDIEHMLEEENKEDTAKLCLRFNELEIERKYITYDLF